MIWALGLSIALRLAALIWSAVLWRRLREWRMGLLTAVIALAVWRQAWALSELWAGAPEGVLWRELPALVVSVLLVLFVALLDRLVVTRRLAILGKETAESQLVELEGQYRRATERASAETGEAARRLWRSERRYRSLFEESLDAIFISTPSGELVDINPAGVALFGYGSREELLEVDIARDLYWDPWERVRSLRLLVEQGVLRDHELVLKKKDGTKLRVIESATAVRDENGEVLAVQGILRDVTEQRRLERELRRSQRMEAVGRLAGGVAHDFNNLLTVINGQADLILAGLEPDHPLYKEVGEIKAAGRRAAALTRQLLILGRRRVTPALETVDLNGILEEREPMLRQVVGREIEVVLDLADDLVPVRIDGSLLEQLLLNLAINARETMSAGGELRIETGLLTIGSGSPPAPVGLAAGRYARLRVEDTGEGIDDSAREHLFEPFYSAAGGGAAGLGLATVYGIVEQSGGAIRVDSEPGHGTAFEILLPESAPAQALDAGASAAGGSETILLAEDEPPVRSLLQEYLVGQGYRVLEAADGNEAMAIARRADAQIDLLLADVVMPGMRGSDLARQVSESWPGVRVLLMSGYTDIPLAGLEEGADFIQKPFSTELLGLKVRELLDRAG